MEKVVARSKRSFKGKSIYYFFDTRHASDTQDDRGFSAELIRYWMGDFSAITSIPKKMARMGQCFSSTAETVKVPVSGDTVEEEADIVGGQHPVSGNPYVFSDGIGKISKTLLQKVSLVCRRRLILTRLYTYDAPAGGFAVARSALTRKPWARIQSPATVSSYAAFS